VGKEKSITIDGHAVSAPEGSTIMEAADKAGIYIPRLCYRPGLAPASGMKADSRVYRCGEMRADDKSENKAFAGCNICIVEVEGRGMCRSCSTAVAEGMAVQTSTAGARESRKETLARILSDHPHACIVCAEKDGCDREECTMGVEKNSRCCSKFDDCELLQVSEYVAIRNDVSQYVFGNIAVADTPFFTYDGNLCIGCGRCIRACETTQGKRVIGFTWHGGRFTMGTSGPSHKESGCVFCGACVAACPTGALMDKGPAWKKKAELGFPSVILPPARILEATEENINGVPEVNGVYELLDERREVIYIHGTENIRRDLGEKLPAVEKARFFRFEEHGMYTMRENEMVERFLNKHGALPEVNNEIADLY
jgi:ferredoxin